MQDGYRLKAVIPGGSSVPVIKADVVDKVCLDYESCQASGTLLGSAGLIVIDHTQDMVHLLTVLARFYSHESCGQCTPCREGTGWAYRVLQRIQAGEGTPRDLETLRSIATGMSGATICFLADSLAMPIQSFLKNFPEEFEAKVKKAVPRRGCRMSSPTMQQAVATLERSPCRAEGSTGCLAVRRRAKPAPRPRERAGGARSRSHTPRPKQAVLATRGHALRSRRRCPYDPAATPPVVTITLNGSPSRSRPASG